MLTVEVEGCDFVRLGVQPESYHPFLIVRFIPADIGKENITPKMSNIKPNKKPRCENSSPPLLYDVAFKAIYPYQLPNGQDMFTESSKGLHKVLSEPPLSSSSVASTKSHHPYLEKHYINHESIDEINKPSHWLNDEVVNLTLQSMIRNYNQDEVLILNPNFWLEYLIEKKRSNVTNGIGNVAQR